MNATAAEIIGVARRLPQGGRYAACGGESILTTTFNNRRYSPKKANMIRRILLSTIAIVLFTGALRGADYQAAKSNDPPPTGAVAPEITALLQTTGIKVSKGSAVFCEIWLSKEWPIAADAKTGGE